MTITVELPLEVEGRLREQAAACGQSVEEYVRTLVLAAAGPGAVNPGLRSAQWADEWRAWAASHRPLPALADDSREGIYAGRGE